MADEVKCPYCSSRDLSTLPVPPGASTQTNSIIYKCRMCQRTFSKTPSPSKED